MPSQTPVHPSSPATPPLCRHVRMSGHRCHALALKDQDFCYSHDATHMERRQEHAARATRPSRRPPTPEALFRLSSLDNFVIIHAALGAILAGLAANTLGPRRATPMFRALSIAGRNTAARVPDPPPTGDVTGDVAGATQEQLTAEIAAIIRLIGCGRSAAR